MLPELKKQLDKNHLKTQKALQELHAQEISISYHQNTFFNVNTMEDLKKLQSLENN